MGGEVPIVGNSRIIMYGEGRKQIEHKEKRKDQFTITWTVWSSEKLGRRQ